MKIGAITVGQSPRVDVTEDILDMFGPEVQLLEKGGLDGLSKEEILAFAPQNDEYVLVSRLQDGSSVTFAEKYILPRLQDCINQLEREGVSLIMFFCTGDFPNVFTSSVPLIFPNRILQGVVPALVGPLGIIVVIPSPLQIEQSLEKWEGLVPHVSIVAASPYGRWDQLEIAAQKVSGMEGNLIVLDCIGYSQRMKELFARKTGKQVVLSRTILARVVSELTDV